MNIFWREMRANRKSLLIWCIGMIAMMAASMGKYAGYSSSVGSINDLVAQMPKALQVMFNLNYFDLSKVSGYYGMLFIYLLLMTTIHASLLGGTIITKEEQDKTAEFLFVKPVSRAMILTAKLAAAIVNIVILNLVTYFSSLVFIAPYQNGEVVNVDIGKLMIGMLLLQLLFVSIGASAAVFSKHPKYASSLSTGILLVTFLLSRAIEINSKLEFLQYVTPFKYFEAKTIMYGGTFQPVFLVLTCSIIGVLGIMMYRVYQQKDVLV